MGIRPPKKKTYPNYDWEGLLSDSTHDLRRLSNVVRFSSIPVTYAETTAEHSFYVAIYALMIHQELERAGSPSTAIAKRGRTTASAQDAQELFVIRHALTHDLGECVGGDVVRTLKYATAEMKEAVDRAESILMRKLLPPRVASTAVEEVPPLARAVVKAADFMSLFHFMRREAARRNFEIYPFYWRMVRDLESAQKSALPELRNLYAAMVSESKAVSRDCFGDMESVERQRRWYRDI